MMMKLINKFLNFFSSSKNSKKKKDLDVAKRISFVNSELLQLKIIIEKEVEIYVMQKYVNDAAKHNMLN
ncbi:MAG: hypothetical protein AABY22_31130 [Nanoarchaeota archaeon]